MKMLITGASGLAGRAVCEAALRRSHAVRAVYFQHPPALPPQVEVIQADLRQPDILLRGILEDWPDAIVNACGLAFPAWADARPDDAESLHAALPRRLAQIALHVGARLVHLSCASVFDGEAAPYRSTDMPLPRHLLGQLQLLGEKEVLEHHPDDPVVLRCSMLTGNSLEGRASPHEMLLDAAATQQRPRFFTDEFVQPCAVTSLASVIVELCERRDLHGIFHWAGAERISRYLLAERTLAHFGLPLDVVVPMERRQHPAATQRPQDLSLTCEPLVGKVKEPLRDVAQQLGELRVPQRLYPWFRENSRFPERFPQRFVV